MSDNQPNGKNGQKKYKIKIDRNLCIGAASCVALAMKTFALDEENKAVVLEGDGDPPEAIKLAAESCPTKAIILENIETGEQEYP
ncbi:ferredoxin [Candidatus Curtissbacteria bacterium]|nr:ferredoxin [Candidatus Curtissbacteria bacterium]